MKDSLTVCREHLFDNLEETNIPTPVKARVLRVRSAYAYWLEYPRKRDVEIRNFIRKANDVALTTAYEDIRIVKALLGDIAKTSKDWHRYRFVQMVEETYEHARKRGDSKAMASIAATYAKHTDIRTEDPERLPWETINVQPFEITSDPSVLGIKPIPNIDKRIEELKKRYSREAIDTNYTDVDFIPAHIENLIEITRKEVTDASIPE